MHELSAGTFATVPEKTSATRVSVAVLVVQGASRRARDLVTSVAVVVPAVLRALVVLVFVSRDFVAISAFFACCAAEMSAARILSTVVGFGVARDLVALMAVLGEVALRVMRVRVRSLCDFAAMLASFAACGVAAAAACVVGIVVCGEFFVARGGEGFVGKLSLVGFFLCPGWL
jgi:hypothetical protein